MTDECEGSYLVVEADAGPGLIVGASCPECGALIPVERDGKGVGRLAAHDPERG